MLLFDYQFNYYYAMNEKVKVIIVFFVCAEAIVAVGSFFTFGLKSAALIAVICAVLFGIVGFRIEQIAAQRNMWKAHPIPAEIDLFDAFFWQQIISQQEWYLKNIYSKDEIKSLIRQYESRIQEVWDDENLDIDAKINKANIYSERLKSLQYHLDYTRDYPYC
ncbi:MAG: hypothetical protein IJ689_04645 [Alphaproteobacteria bacterium]|nr:hypothetical protein [Alphaproteobacteria bacterium]